jgi:hypothetical protein
MKRTLLLLLLNNSYSLFAQERFQLAPPLLKYNSVFFADKTTVEIKFAQSETRVHYTLNNNEPAEQDPVYTEPIRISKNLTTLKAKAFGNNFLPSAIVAATFIKEGKRVRSVQYTLPDAKYPGSGSNTLIDNKGGMLLISSTTWMGYKCDTVSITMDMGKPQSVKEVLLNFLQSENSWVFLPEQIIVYWFNDKTSSFQTFGKELISSDKETAGTHCNYRMIAAKNKIKTNKIFINIVVQKTIPSWHAAKGEHAWMFIDEIKVY